MNQGSSITQEDKQTLKVICLAYLVMIAFAAFGFLMPKPIIETKSSGHIFLPISRGQIVVDVFKYTNETFSIKSIKHNGIFGIGDDVEPK